jgi:hypothetical protein
VDVTRNHAERKFGPCSRIVIFFHFPGVLPSSLNPLKTTVCQAVLSYERSVEYFRDMVFN